MLQPAQVSTQSLRATVCSTTQASSGGVPPRRMAHFEITTMPIMSPSLRAALPLLNWLQGKLTRSRCSTYANQGGPGQADFEITAPDGTMHQDKTAFFAGSCNRTALFELCCHPDGDTNEYVCSGKSMEQRRKVKIQNRGGFSKCIILVITQDARHRRVLNTHI